MFTANRKSYFLIFLPYKSEMKERFSALSFVRLPEGIRHAQFVPPKVLGVFILASFPKSRISCIGMITHIALLMRRALIIFHSTSSSLHSKYLLTISLVLSSRLLYQPTVVLLSWVPVYATLTSPILWIRYSLVVSKSPFSLKPKANWRIFIPGRPLLSLRASTSSVITPRSSAMIGRDGPSSFFTVSKNFCPGPLIHSPLMAVSSP